MFTPSSPTRRRESTPLLEKIKTDVNIARARIAAALEKKDEPKKPQKPKDESPIMKYIKTQVTKFIYYNECQKAFRDEVTQNLLKCVL